MQGKLLYLACAASPGVVVSEVIREIRTRRPQTHGEAGAHPRKIHLIGFDGSG